MNAAPHRTRLRFQDFVWLAAYAVAMLAAFGCYGLATRPKLHPKKASGSKLVALAQVLSGHKTTNICGTTAALRLVMK